jgi:predicted metal-dependent peptidase
MTVHAEEARRISAQRMRMLELHPFWGFLLMQVQIVPDPALPVIVATDCVKHIWYNPDLTRKLDADQLGFALAHEVGHAVYATFERQRGRDHHLWNIATDYAINRIVASIPHPSGRGALYKPVQGILLDRRYDGMIAEAIYERILAEAAAAGRGDGRSGRPQPRRVMVAGRAADSHGGELDVHLPGGVSEEQREELADRVRAAVAYAHAQPNRGDIPGDVARDFGPDRSRVPWQRVFRRFVNAALTKDEYDARRPNRRWATQGFVVPSLAGEQVGTVVVALDTSGSMGADELASACAELRALAREVQDLRLVVADARVQEVVTLDGLEVWLKRGRAKGGGGTDHRPVFEWIKQSRIVPDVFIGLTDLFTVLPDRAPPFPVLWVVPKFHGKAAFGRVVEVERG